MLVSFIPSEASNQPHDDPEPVELHDLPERGAHDAYWVEAVEGLDHIPVVVLRSVDDNDHRPVENTHSKLHQHQSHTVQEVGSGVLQM